LLRYPKSTEYQRDPQAAQRSDYWANRFAYELLIYSSIWGLAPWMFLPDNNLPMTVLTVLIILGLASGSVPAVAHRWSATLCFLLPMLLSLIAALALRGDAVHLFLAACTGVYLGATLYFARVQNRLLTDALLTRFEKEALADKLAQQIAITERASHEKTRFFASASHDLRQPLHAIALFGAVLQKELQAHPAQANATRLMRAVHALGTSLDTMLDISRLDAGVIETNVRAVSLNPMLQSINQMFASRADEKGLQLRLRASPLWVRTDPELLQRLLTNLVENAIKYTVQGGVLVVARQRGTTTWIDVCDTGVGIAPEQQGKIFDEFYQVNNPGRDRSQGLGIGLSIVRRLSILLGHPVEVHSRPGRGSQFRLMLPTAPAQIPARAGNPIPDVELSPATEAGPALPHRVLMIDDETDIGHAVSALLEAHGSQLQVVRDETAAAAAFIHASQQGQPFQAMLCDYRLADGADGLAAAQRLRTRFHPHLPLLLVTGETAPERLQQLRNSGVPVLFKPVPANILLQALVELTCPKAQPAGI
jgi:signal transduction histidine kinase